MRAMKFLSASLCLWSCQPGGEASGSSAVNIKVVEIETGLGIDMVLIPDGTFAMGSARAA